MAQKLNLSTVLFLHGALGTSEDLRPLRDILEQKGLKTLGFDFSGHGQTTPWPDEFRIDLFARDLERFLKDHGLKKVTVFGYSMGGYVALYHKAHFEDSPIDQIFTYGTKFNWSQSAVAKELPMLVPEHLDDKFPQFSEILRKKHGDRWKQLLRSTAHMMQNLEKLDGLTREDVSSIEIPVNLILGEQDRMVTQEETKTFGSWLHHHRLQVIGHSKHELEKSNLTELSQLLLKEVI
jgi:pimeloyl-ACP methyl ester carboxylesterase